MQESAGGIRSADVNYMEIYTELNPEDEWPEKRTVPELADLMREELEIVVPTAVIAFTQPVQMRVEELISGVRATRATGSSGAVRLKASNAR